MISSNKKRTGRHQPCAWRWSQRFAHRPSARSSFPGLVGMIRVPYESRETHQHLAREKQCISIPISLTNTYDTPSNWSTFVTICRVSNSTNGLDAALGCLVSLGGAFAFFFGGMARTSGREPFVVNDVQFQTPAKISTSQVWALFALVFRFCDDMWTPIDV